MALIEIKAEMTRVAGALERIALALERLSPPPLPALRSNPKPSRSSRPEPLKREIISDLIAQGVPEDQAVVLSDLSDFDLMKRGVMIDHDLFDLDDLEDS